MTDFYEALDPTECKRVCYEVPSLAPRDGCGCRACADEREALLDPGLVALARSNLFATEKVSAAAPYIHRAISTFLAGHCSLAEMNLTLIKALAEQNDRLMELILQAQSLSLKPPLFVTDPKPRRSEGGTHG